MRERNSIMEICLELIFIVEAPYYFEVDSVTCFIYEILNNVVEPPRSAWNGANVTGLDELQHINPSPSLQQIIKMDLLN